MLSEMQLRPTVRPAELAEVNKHETVQKILKKNKPDKRQDNDSKTNRDDPPPSNDFLDNLVARNVGKGQQ